MCEMPKENKYSVMALKQIDPCCESDRRREIGTTSDTVRANRNWDTPSTWLKVSRVRVSGKETTKRVKGLLT